MSSPSSSPRYYFVDDNSTDIEYQGSWSLTTVTSRNYTAAGLPSFPMYGTVHTYDTDNAAPANFTYTFDGSFIEVRFIQSPSNDDVACTIDGKSQSLAANGCSSTSLVDGRHTLLIAMKPGSFNSHIFDYIRYIPTANIGSPPGDSWISIGDDTVKSTKLSNGSAILSPGGILDLEFIGSSLSLYMASVNTDPHLPTQGFYTIDGTDHVNFTLENAATSLTTYIYPQTLIQTPQLPYGKHRFHFSLTPPLDGEPETMPLRGTILVQNSSSALEAIPAAIVIFDFPPPPSKSPRLGGIIGGTLATVFVAALLMFLVIHRRRRKLLITRHFVNETDLVHPFFSSRGPRNDTSRRPTEKIGTGSSGIGPYGSTTDASDTPPSMRRPRDRVHQDSGEDVIQPDEGTEIVDLPPMYEGIEARRTQPSPPTRLVENTTATTVKNPIVMSWRNSQ